MDARITPLFNIAVHVHRALTPSYVLRMTSLEGVVATIQSTQQAEAWLRQQCPSLQVFDVACGVVAIVPDPYTGGWRGSSGVDANAACAATIVYHYACVATGDA